MGEPEDAWAADMVFGSEPSAAPPTQTLVKVIPETRSASVPEHKPAQLDAGEESDVAGVSDVNAGAKKTAVALGSALVCAVVAIVGTLVTFSDNEPAAAPSTAAPAVMASVPAPAQSSNPTDLDQAVSYTASADCPPGSTSAQALTDTTSDSAWVCVRGSAGAAVDGQVLRVDFSHSYVLSAVSITPGWVAKTPGGEDEWFQHRVVSRLQYIFDDTDRTVFTQTTGDVRGPVTTPLPHKVLASCVTIVILQTARPNAFPLPTPDESAPIPPDFGDSLLGAGAAPPLPGTTTSADLGQPGEQGSDPVDATFAVSALKFLGHEPD